ncbi:hypothetical protein [Methanomethylophilus alvi]|uniref:hypothetical protein n=1 Tax=Methanomethylophilus alvi TaxID=1291540 RepID=UPI0037DC4BC3
MHGTVSSAFSTTGTIIVSDMASLTVEGYGSRAYSIGGDGSSVTIEGFPVYQLFFSSELPIMSVP